MALALEMRWPGFGLESRLSSRRLLQPNIISFFRLNYFASLFFTIFAVGCRLLLLMSVICNLRYVKLRSW